VRFHRLFIVDAALKLYRWRTRSAIKLAEISSQFQVQAGFMYVCLKVLTNLLEKL